MIKRLSNHIKKVLIQDKCCILPLLGGFVCENIPAFKDSKRGLIMPPCSEIYFNRNLSYDDGALQQSYANTYSLSMRRAKAMLNSDLKELRECLVKEKSVVLHGIGELVLSQDGNIGFNRSFQEYGDSPMYGLVPFIINENTSYKYNYKNNNNDDKYINIRVNRTALNVAVALISIIFVLLPLGEITYSKNDVYKAGVSVSHTNTATEKQSTKHKVATADLNKNEVVETKSKHEIIEKKYHVIVASDKKEEKLIDYKSYLLNEGYVNTIILSGKNMNRISIDSFENESEAYTFIRDLKKKSSKFDTAWVYKK